MAWAEVSGSKAAASVDTTDTTIAATMGASVPSGALMWACVHYEGTTDNRVASIAGGGTWTKVTTASLPGPDTRMEIWKAVATSTAAHTVTVTFTVTRTFRKLYIGAWEGNEAAGAVEASLGETDATSGAPSVTISTAVDGCLLMGFTYNTDVSVATAGSGFSAVTSSGGTRPISQETKVQTTASGSTVIDFTVSGTPTNAICGVAFQPAAAGGGYTPPVQEFTKILFRNA